MDEYDYLADPYYDTGMPYAPEQSAPQKEKGRGKYRFLCLLFFLFSVGGLFIGFLGKVVGALAHLPYIAPQYDAPLAGTLLDTAINLFKNLGTIFSSLGSVFKNNFSEGIWVVSFYVLIVCTLVSVLIVCTLVSALIGLITFIISLAAKKKSTTRGCALFSGVFLMIVYGGLFFYGLAMGGTVHEKLCMEVLDLPCAILALLAFILLFIVTCGHNKGRGAVNALLLLLTAATCFFLCYPGGAFLAGALLPFEFNLFPALVTIANMVMAIALLFNLLFAAFRLNAHKSAVFEILRYAILLLASVYLVVAYMLPAPNGMGASNLFVAPQLLYTIFLLAFSLVCLLISIFTQVLYGVAKKQKKAQENVQPMEQYDDSQAYAPNYADPYGEGYQPDYAGEGYDSPTNITVTLDGYQQGGTQAPKQEAKPEPEPQKPEPQPQPQPQPQPVQPQPQPVVREVIREVIREPQPVQPQPQPQPEPKKPEPTDFELRMAAIARGNVQSPQPQPVQPQMDYGYGFQQPMQPKPRPTYSAPAPRNYERPHTPSHGNQDSYSGSSQYTYDPFINTLTPAEKNEFGDVFIANVHGIRSYLPTYVIGGDNSEFFQTVFIYLGRYRSYISQELMEKIYAYVSRS